MNVEEIREMYPEGTQIILQEMQGESQMSKGLKGTVTHVDDAGHIHMSWENGSSLALVIDVDTFEKVEPVDLKPIGRIDYLHTDGRVCESVEYTNPSQFEKDIINKNNYGVPMIINFYKDKDGNHIPDSFLSSLDSPLQGIEYIDSPLMSNGAEEKTMSDEKKISIILVEPNKYPRVVEIEDSLEAMQSLVGGNIEEYMPYEDEVAIICNEKGKMIGMPLNRAIYSEPETVEMSYGELKNHFRQAEKDRNHAVGYVVFTEDSFDKPYTEEQRTYVISSNNKAFIEGMGGYSIYGSSLDGTDNLVRLEAYMADEHGGKDGWKIEKCYVKDESNRKMLDIIAGKFFICYAPFESEKFLSMPKELENKYMEKFKYPERFHNTIDGIKAISYKPETKERTQTL